MVKQWGRELVLYLFCLTFWSWGWSAVQRGRYTVRRKTAKSNKPTANKTHFTWWASAKCSVSLLLPVENGREVESPDGSFSWKPIRRRPHTNTHAQTPAAALFKAVFALRGDRKHFLNHNQKQRLFHFFNFYFLCNHNLFCDTYFTLFCYHCFCICIYVGAKRETPTKSFFI